MLQSFIVYIILAASLMLLGIVSAKREEIHLFKGIRLSFWTWEIILALVIFAFISGIRWNVGVDHLSYLRNYQDLLRGWNLRRDNLEVGYVFITKLFANLNIHFTIYFGFLAFLQLFFIYYAVKNERYLLPFIGLIIVLGPEYLSWMNGIRQMLAASIFVFAIQFIQNRKLILYMLTILLASTFHSSALLLLIFYFIPHFDYFKNRYINLGLLVASLIIGFNPEFMRAVTFIENTLAIIGYDRYAERFYIMVEYRREMAVGPRRLIILMLNAATIWYAPKLKKVFSHTNYLIYFNFAFIGILMHNLFANTSHIFLRPVSYFTIFLVLTTAYLLYYLKTKTPKGVSIQFIIIFIIAASYTLLSVINSAGLGETDFAGFKFFWDYVQ